MKYGNRRRILPKIRYLAPLDGCGCAYEERVYGGWKVTYSHEMAHFISLPLSFEPRHDKTNKMSVCPAKTQISLGIRPVWSESSLCAQWVAKDPSFLHADSEDSDQTGQMSRLIWVLAGRTTTLLVLSCHGSFDVLFPIPISKIKKKILINLKLNKRCTFTLQYRKFPKYSDTPKIRCNHSKILTMWLYHTLNDVDRMANSVDPDQTAPLGAVWSGSALFAQAYLSENGSLR